MRIKFTEDLLTGVEEMDNQHKKIVDLINKTAERIAAGELQEAIRIFKEDLMPFVKYHLEQEEQFMASINYPEIEEHKRHHKWVIDLFNKIGSSLEDKESARQALALVTGWLYGHVGKVDKKYGVYSAAKTLK
ncbi:MAG: bacteriohemerythrin [Aquificaceae bacterium]